MFKIKIFFINNKTRKTIISKIPLNKILIFSGDNQQKCLN